MKVVQQVMVIMVLTYAAAMFTAAVFNQSGSANMAHGGGTDKCGCHTNRKTDEYHCHTRKQRGGDCPPQESSVASPSSGIEKSVQEVS